MWVGVKFVWVGLGFSGEWFCKVLSVTGLGNLLCLSVMLSHGCLILGFVGDSGVAVFSFGFACF